MRSPRDLALDIRTAVWLGRRQWKPALALFVVRQRR